MTFSLLESPGIEIPAIEAKPLNCPVAEERAA